MNRPVAADMWDVFKWDPAYSLNIGSIDAQHRSLLAIGRELSNALSIGHSRAMTYNIVDRLARYAASHFSHEERLMRTRGYPDLAAHQAEHQAMTAQVVQFRADLEAGRASLSIELLQSMEKLIVGHFQGSDRRYSNFLHEEAAD